MLKVTQILLAVIRTEKKINSDYVKGLGEITVIKVIFTNFIIKKFACGTPESHPRPPPPPELLR